MPWRDLTIGSVQVTALLGTGCVKCSGQSLKYDHHYAAETSKS